MTARSASLVALVGALGWVGLIWLGVQLYGTNPRTAGFDLELLLGAGGAVADGRSPYDPALVAGAAPVAERLFYSYPPAVAQLMSLVAAIPSPLVFVGWVAAAVAGLGLVARALALRFSSPDSPISPNAVALSVVAFVPLLFPFAIGLLFGNLDVFFPLVFGLLVLGVTQPSAQAASGTAIALAAISKLHPASVGAWLVARSVSSADSRRVLAVAIAVGLAVVGASVAVWGTQPWLDYAAVVRAGSGADLVDPRNAGPAAQIALLIGGGGAGAESLARTLQVPVTIIALLATIVVALRIDEPVESLGWATAASLVVLPVTWYHYPSALIPFAIVAILRSSADPRVARRVRWMVLSAAVISAAAIAWLVLIYVAIGLVLVAVRESRPARATPRD